MSETLSEAFEQAITNKAAANFEKIETRRCTSDNYDGIQYNIYGSFIPVRPVIDVVADIDGKAIEQLHLTNDENTCLGVFVADIPEQSHPAFIDS